MDQHEFQHLMERIIYMLNSLLDITSKEHLTSSTVGHIINGSPKPRGFLSSETPDDIENASSAIHFSSKEPREENCNYVSTLEDQKESYKRGRSNVSPSLFLSTSITPQKQQLHNNRTNLFCITSVYQVLHGNQLRMWANLQGLRTIQVKEKHQVQQ